MTKFRFEAFCEKGSFIYSGIDSVMATALECAGYVVIRYWDNQPI
jgi:hypothetical protein